MKETGAPNRQQNRNQECGVEKGSHGFASDNSDRDAGRRKLLCLPGNDTSAQAVVSAVEDSALTGGDIA